METLHIPIKLYLIVEEHKHTDLYIHMPKLITPSNNQHNNPTLCRTYNKVQIRKDSYFTYEGQLLISNLELHTVYNHHLWAESVSKQGLLILALATTSF